MDYQEFYSEILKKNSKKKFKVSNSWGVYDALKHVRKNGWYNIGRPVTEHEFYTIVRSINDMLADEIANGHTITFPQSMGQLELRRRPCEAKMVDGKLKITYPVDWNKTIRLWYEDEEAKTDKVLIRSEQKSVYVVRYNRYKADYNNKWFYEFCLNRFIKIRLKEKINAGEIDTLYSTSNYYN